MTLPQRIQRRRTKGWRMPENTIYVGRGSRWGNPHAVGSAGFTSQGVEFEHTHETAVRAYRYWIKTGLVDAIIARESLDLLRGKNLACWCPLDQPCHADVLLELANQETP